MKSKPLPLSFARCLLRLLNGDKLRPGEIKSKRFLNGFHEDRIIHKQSSGSRRYVYFCPNNTALENYLKVQYDILSLESYINGFEEEHSDGENSLIATKSTKIFRNKSLQGFFIKALNTEIEVSGKKVKDIPDGIGLFVYQPENLKIKKEALIVGVENPECFIKFEKLTHYFGQKEIVVIMRYLSQSPNNWLKTLPNKYLHFGDFDPAGIHIYLNEYRKLLPAHRCSFFIPTNIESLVMQYGLTGLYENQVHLLKNIEHGLYPEVAGLIHILNMHRKGLEQERLLTLE